jgi:hypothetical protein
LRFIIASTLCLISATANAAHQIIGPGTQSCGKWLKLPENDLEKYAYKTWVQGFLSAANLLANDEFLKQTDPAAIFTWMDNYCRQNPLYDLNSATMALTIELSKRAHGN